MFNTTVIYITNLWLYIIIAVMTISKNTVISIKQLLTVEQKPKWIEENILNEIKLGIKHLKLVVQKDLLETCLRKRLYPDEIKSIAKRIIGQYAEYNTEMKIKKEEQKLMRFRIRLKQEKYLIC